MDRRWLLGAALGALLSAGCVPVVNPVGDIEKAVPDEALVGTWKENDTSWWVVDRPEVRGNPKGVMRLRVFQGDKAPAADDVSKDHMWFFVAPVGKFRYANLLIDLGGPVYADLSKEGAYKVWRKKPRYWVGQLALTGDTLTIDPGSKSDFEDLMKEQKIESVDGYFKTPPGWLETHLKKAGDGVKFNVSPTELTRVKKK